MIQADSSSDAPGQDRLTEPVRSPKPFLSPKEFYGAMGGSIGLNTLYELIRARRIRSVKLGRKILIPNAEVHAFPEREATRLS